MDATELYELYRPLWEKVPECKPTWLGLFVPKSNEDMRTPRRSMFEGTGAWWDMGDRGVEFEPEIAAALCRVAVEDWLAFNGNPRSAYNKIELLFGAKDGSDARGGVLFDYRDAPAGGFFYRVERGPTLHHALVEAALAVAGEKK